MFNPITYSKAASILKMMYHVIGEVPWREFLVSFVAKNKFGNVDTNDFFDALENIISHDTVLKDHNFKDIFLAWYVQKKIPTVYIRHDFIFLSQSACDLPWVIQSAISSHQIMQNRLLKSSMLSIQSSVITKSIFYLVKN